MKSTDTERRLPTVLITGSSGLIGSQLVKRLADCGEYRVVGLDQKPPQEQPPGFQWIACDLTNDLDVRAAIPRVRQEHGEQLASVVHLAAHYDLSGRPSPLYQELTVEGTRRLLRNLRLLEVEQFIFSSTMLVLKPDEEKPLTAASELQPEWAYPMSQLQAERVIADERGSIPTIVLRIANVYDEGCHSIPLAQQISRIYQKRLDSHIFPGKATHGQAYLYLEDLTSCIRRAVDHRRRLARLETFVVGEEEVVSYEALQEQIGALIHRAEWPTIRVPKPVAKVVAWVQQKLATDEEAEPFIKPWMIDLADQHYALDTQRVREKLEWTPEHRLQDTLPYMIGQLVADPKKWYEDNGLKVPDELQLIPQ